MTFKANLSVNQDLSSITLYPLQQFWKFVHIRNQSNYQSFIPQILRVVGLGKKFEFFSPLGFKIQSNFDLQTTKVKLESVRAFYIIVL